jgi:hypothetical protein
MITPISYYVGGLRQGNVIWKIDQRFGKSEGQQKKM